MRKGTVWFATNAKQDSGAMNVQWNALKVVRSILAMQRRDTALKVVGKGFRMTSVTNSQTTFTVCKVSRYNVNYDFMHFKDGTEFKKSTFMFVLCNTHV